MNDLQQPLKKGTLLVIETGEYSDRNWFGPVRMLKTASKADLIEKFREQWKPPADAEYEWEKKPNSGDFMPWLVKSGFAEDVPNVESWHVGSYGDFDPY